MGRKSVAVVYPIATFAGSARAWPPAATSKTDPAMKRLRILIMTRPPTLCFCPTLSVGRAPAQRTPLDLHQQEVSHEAQSAEDDEAGIQIGAAIDALGVEDVPSQSRQRRLHFGDDRENERDRKADPQAGDDVWQRRRQRNLPDERAAIESENVRHLPQLRLDRGKSVHARKQNR